MQAPAHNFGETRPRWEQFLTLLEEERITQQTRSFSYINSNNNNIRLVWFNLISLFPCPLCLPLWCARRMSFTKRGRKWLFTWKETKKQEQILTPLQVEPLAGRDPRDGHFLKNLIWTRAFLIKCTHKEQSFCCVVTSLHLSHSDSATT